MKRYRCHKVVEAAEIVATADNTVTVRGEGRRTHLVLVPPSFWRSPGPGPEIGDYLVRYEDGYLSWSPKAAFEAGYQEIAEPDAAPSVAESFGQGLVRSARQAAAIARGEG